MATGGLRDISSLGTPRRPVSSAFSEHEEDMRDVDVASPRSDAAGLLEDGDYLSSDEDGMSKKKRYGGRGHARTSSSVYDRASSARINPIPIGEHSRNKPQWTIFGRLRTDREKLMSRARVVFRAFSLIASGTVAGALSHILFQYLRGQDDVDDDGQKMWPEGITKMPTVLMLAIALYTFLTDLGFLIGSAWPNFRYLRNRVIASLVCINSLTSSIGWILSITFSASQRASKPTLFKVCDNDVKDIISVDSQRPDFALHCSELKFTWFAAIIVATAQALVVVTILVGCFSGRPSKPKYREPKDVSRARRQWSLRGWWGQMVKMMTWKK